MALSDPFQLLLVLGAILLIPALVIYWIVRLAVRHELKKRNPVHIQALTRAAVPQ